MKPSIPDDGAVDSQIGTAYDVVKTVADNLPALLELAEDFDNLEQNFVPKTRTINGKDLTANIVINYSDLGNIPATLTDYSNGIASAGTGIFKKTAAGVWSFTSLVAADIPALDAGKITSGILPVSLGGTGRNDNKSSAWISARTFTIGSTGKSVDGSAAVTWTLAEIGAQPVDATLTAMAGVTTAADRYIYFTNSDVAVAGTITTFGRSLIDDLDAAAARSTLGLGSAATQASTAFQTADATLTAIAGLVTAADKGIYSTSADTFATYDLSAFGRSVSATANATALNTLLGVRTKADQDILANILSRATVDYDFFTGIYKKYQDRYLTQLPLNDLFTFNRSTASTAEHPYGLVTYDINEPVIAYNPVNGDRLGLRVTPQNTNLLLNSQFVGANGETAATGWAIFSNSGITTTEASSRYAGATRIKHTGNLQREAYYRAVTLAPLQTYVFSVYFAAGTIADGNVLRVLGESGDTPTGVTTLAGSSVTGPGVYSITFTTGAVGGTYGVYVGLGCTGNATGTVIHETPQLELNLVPTAYTPTPVGATQSRTTDNIVDSWVNLPEFTLLFDIADNGTNDFTVVGGAGNTFNDCVYAADTTWNIRNNNAVVATLNSGVVTNQRNCIALRCKAGDYASFRNGVKVAASSAATGPAQNMARFKIGSAPWETTATNANTTNLTYKRVTIIPRALTDAEAILLTQ